MCNDDILAPLKPQCYSGLSDTVRYDSNSIDRIHGPTVLTNPECPKLVAAFMA